MTTRKIVHIDEEKCNGCGECVPACHEGALAVVDGKARLIAEVYCDGLGDCLGTCPQDAITVEEREAEEFDAAAVDAHLAEQDPSTGCSCPGAAAQTLSDNAAPAAGGCPGSALRKLYGDYAGCPRGDDDRCGACAPDEPKPEGEQSKLGHWPVQPLLIPPGTAFLEGADIVVCADCVPFAVPDFHARYLDGRAVLVGCPKLDDLAFYREKLKKIFARAKPERLTVLRMEVPCCAGIADAAIDARDAAIPDLPIEVHTIGLRGEITRQVLSGPVN